MVEMPINPENLDALHRDKVFVEDMLESLKVVTGVLESARAELEKDSTMDLRSYIENAKKSFSQMVLDERYPSETRTEWGRHLQMLGYIESQLIARKENL